MQNWRRVRPNLCELDENDLAVMKQLKKKLARPPVLAPPRREQRFIIYIDACGKEVVFVLLQELEDQTLRPVGYWYLV